MKQYATFSIECTFTNESLVGIYNDFREKCKKYCIDEDMELYRIPLGTKTYDYAHELALKYPDKRNDDEIMNDKPVMYIDEIEIFITYEKADYEKAVAYRVNFWYLAYDYEDGTPDDFAGYCCDKPDWSIQIGKVQNRNYRIPKSEFGKRKYAMMMLGYAVADEVRDLLINSGLATERDFLEVITRRGAHICWQIMPEHEFSGFMEENDGELIDTCQTCGMKRYQPLHEPYRMSREQAEKLYGLNRTHEMTGPIMEEGTEVEGPKAEHILEPLYIINREAYSVLHKNYPRMQFVPIFAKK
ncbi:MAG: hypothetical protein IJ733_05685 [Lachnospiraceae bacterium]|nr:hypothetical protein [Lachnospiraceae bacterium]